MSTVLDQYNELVALTELHILDEMDLRDWMVTDPESAKIFKECPSQNLKTQTPVQPSPVVARAMPEPGPIKQATPIRTAPPPPAPKVKVLPPVAPASAPVKEEPDEKSTWLQPRPAVKEQDLGDLHKLMTTQFPHITLREAVLEATQVLRRTPSAAVALIVASHNTPQQHLALLNNLANAIEHVFGPCALTFIEDTSWSKLLSEPTLQAVVMQQQDVEADRQAKQMLNHASDAPHLGKVPLLLLADLNGYFSEPKRKEMLWNTLCRLLKHP